MAASFIPAHILWHSLFPFTGEFEAKHGDKKVHVYQAGESFGVSSLLFKKPHS